MRHRQRDAFSKLGQLRRIPPWRGDAGSPVCSESSSEDSAVPELVEAAVCQVIRGQLSAAFECA